MEALIRVKFNQQFPSILFRKDILILSVFNVRSCSFMSFVVLLEVIECNLIILLEKSHQKNTQHCAFLF